MAASGSSVNRCATDGERRPASHDSILRRLSARRVGSAQRSVSADHRPCGVRRGGRQRALSERQPVAAGQECRCRRTRPLARRLSVERSAAAAMERLPGGNGGVAGSPSSTVHRRRGGRHGSDMGRTLGTRQLPDTSSHEVYGAPFKSAVESDEFVGC